jgi:hypothetical protein
MAFGKPDQLALKNIASFSQGSRIPHGMPEQFTPNKKIPDMLALRNFGDLFSIFHRLPFDISPLSILPVCAVDTTSFLEKPGWDAPITVFFTIPTFSTVAEAAADFRTRFFPGRECSRIPERRRQRTQMPD